MEDEDIIRYNENNQTLKMAGVNNLKDVSTMRCIIIRFMNLEHFGKTRPIHQF